MTTIEKVVENDLLGHRKGRHVLRERFLS